MEEFKVGDVVTLKSDTSALFTVGEILNYTSGIHVRVYWFNHADNAIRSIELPVGILKK